LYILHRAVALEALYDSADSFPQPRCHLETRTKMLDDLYKWATRNSGRPICWLHGPAGAGKSAIMQTLCQKLQDAGPLGGAFFFKRGHSTRGNGKVLFATLAYQLALTNRNLKDLISESVICDPSVVARHMDIQLCNLIVEPCKSFRDSAIVVLLIDGLDECDNQGAQIEILRMIGRAVRQHSKLRFLIASRPEAHISDILKDPSFDGILDSVNVEQAFEDIRTYFRDEFARIYRDHRDTMVGVPTPWPSQHSVEDLVQKSSGYFIYASTVIKFIDDKYFRPTDRLAAVENLIHTNSEAPFEALDKLYNEILSEAPTRFRSALCNILQCAVFNLDKTLSLTSLQIEQLLELQPGDLRLIFRRLRSILWINPALDISFYHASFLDFLQDPQRSSIFCIGLESRTNVTRAVLKALSADEDWLNTPAECLAWYVDLVLCACPFSNHFVQASQYNANDFVHYLYSTFCRASTSDSTCISQFPLERFSI
ncbi:hypothetical protein B0H13DRAFT_1635867, partial [Mycena leptocephala]